MTLAARSLGILSILLGVAAMAVPFAAAGLLVLRGEEPSFIDVVVPLGAGLSGAGVLLGAAGVLVRRHRPAAAAVIGGLICVLVLIGFLVSPLFGA